MTFKRRSCRACHDLGTWWSWEIKTRQCLLWMCCSAEGSTKKTSSKMWWLKTKPIWFQVDFLDLFRSEKPHYYGTNLSSHENSFENDRGLHLQPDLCHCLKLKKCIPRQSKSPGHLTEEAANADWRSAGRLKLKIPKMGKCSPIRFSIPNTWLFSQKSKIITNPWWNCISKETRGDTRMALHGQRHSLGKSDPLAFGTCVAGPKPSKTLCHMSVVGKKKKQNSFRHVITLIQLDILTV